jgi:hypothetical protein
VAQAISSDRPGGLSYQVNATETRR